MVTVRLSSDNGFVLYLLTPTVLSSGEAGGKESFLPIDLQRAWCSPRLFLPFRLGRAHPGRSQEIGGYSFKVSFLQPQRLV